MKLSLLDMVQNILSRLDSDEVNSISDTTEARQVAELIKTAYFNIVSRAALPEHEKIFSLLASGDPSQPVLMLRPDDVNRIDWIKYLNADQSLNEYEYVTIYPLQQFLDLTQRVNDTDSNIGSLTFNGKTFYFSNNGQPRFCTILENKYILFNSYDISIDTTLQSTKSMCFGQKIPTFSMGDSFIPDLDDRQFPLLLNEATSLAFLELKQIANEHSERESRRQWNNLQRSKDTNQLSAFDQLPSFGRKH